MNTREAATLMKYVVSRALPKEQSARLSIAGEDTEFFGAFGLAPAWVERPMNEAEQKRVSACLLARTNAFGAKVSISLRAGTVDLKGYSALQVTEQEQAEYSVFEGAFWGNVFDSPPTAFACFNPELESSILLEHKRVCAVSANIPEPIDAAISMCGFKLVGPCSPELIDGAESLSEHPKLLVYLNPFGQAD
ncbi:MAG: hypothetical protein AB3N07_06340 [Ruegeria sp.]